MGKNHGKRYLEMDFEKIKRKCPGAGIPSTPQSHLIIKTMSEIPRIQEAFLPSSDGTMGAQYG